MSRGDFDYARAWRELAVPMFKVLPANVREVAVRVCVETAERGIHQDRDSLNIPIPADLRAEMEKIPAEYLAEAARCVYFVAHWRPGRAERRDEEGECLNQIAQIAAVGGWRFSNCADQILRERCGLPVNDREHGSGLRFTILEGALRACYSWRHGWMNKDIGPGTPGTLEAARALDWPGGASDEGARKFERVGEQHAAALTENAPKWRRWLSTVETYTPDPERDRRREAMSKLPKLPEGATFKPLRLETTVHPHPFMITNQHIAKAPGGRLDPSVAPCGMKGTGRYGADCDLSYAEHEQSETLFIEVEQNNDLNAIPGLGPWLQLVKDADLGIAGFAFPKKGGA